MGFRGKTAENYQYRPPGNLRSFSGGGPDYMTYTIERVPSAPTMGKVTISPYNSFSEYLRGDLYFPKKAG